MHAAAPGADAECVLSFNVCVLAARAARPSREPCPASFYSAALVASQADAVEQACLSRAVQQERFEEQEQEQEQQQQQQQQRALHSYPYSRAAGQHAARHVARDADGGSIAASEHGSVRSLLDISLSLEQINRSVERYSYGRGGGAGSMLPRAGAAADRTARSAVSSLGSIGLASSVAASSDLTGMARQVSPEYVAIDASSFRREKPRVYSSQVGGGSSRPVTNTRTRPAGPAKAKALQPSCSLFAPSLREATRGGHSSLGLRLPRARGGADYTRSPPLPSR